MLLMMTIMDTSEHMHAPARLSFHIAIRFTYRAKRISIAVSHHRKPSLADHISGLAIQVAAWKVYGIMNDGNHSFIAQTADAGT